MGIHFHKRNLPHYYDNLGIYFITFRLANSIPLEKLQELKNKQVHPNEKIFSQYEKLLESSDYGEKYLSMDAAADIVVNSLHFWDDKHYKLICYSIMPNHVHFVIEMTSADKSISEIMKSIKGISARRINKLLNKKGEFWQEESFDRWIRDEKELYMVIRYILLNPVKCGLVNVWNEWKYTYCRKDYQMVFD